MGKIYVYSTATLMYPRTIHRTEGDLLIGSWHKIGMTEQPDAEVRVKQQDGTSNPEKLLIQPIFNGDVYFDLEPYDITAYEAEQHIHEYFREKGREVRLDASREWFECTLDEIREAIQHIIDPEAHKITLKMMPHQGYETIEFEDGTTHKGTSLFIKERFVDGNSRQILLNEKPRSGKTFEIYEYMLRYKPKNVLTLTNYPVLNNQWINQAKKIKGLDYDFINMSKDEVDEVVIKDETPNFVIMSLQDSKGGEEIFSKKKFDLLQDIVWDLLVIDECHKGVLTEKTAKLLNKLKYNRLIGLSATPTKHLVFGTFPKEDVHAYNIVEENKFKKKFPEIYDLPDISYYLYNVPESVKKELKFYKEDEQFTWGKFLRVEDGRLVYKNDLRVLFSWIAGYYGYGIKSPLKKFDANSILLFVQNTECQSLLVDLLSEIPYYRENYNIHFTNSAVNPDSSKLLEKTKSVFIPRDGKKCLVIANRQLTTGITLKYCDMVMFMNDWESIDEYIQAGFRCQSPMKGKKSCQVIDFTPYRAFNIMNRYIESNAMFNGKSLETNRSEFLDSVSLFESEDSGFKKIDLQAFKDRVVDSMDIASKNFFGNYLIRKDEVVKDCDWLCGKLGHIESSVSAFSKEDLDEERDVEKGKTKETFREKSDKKEEGKSNENLLWALENMEYFLAKTVFLCAYSEFKRDSVKESLDYLRVNPEIKESYVSAISLDGRLGIDFELAELIYGGKYINEDLLNDRVLTLNSKVRKLIYNKKISVFERLVNLIKVLQLVNSYAGISKIEKDLHGEVQTPEKMVREILDMLPSDFWTKDRKILDMAAGSGIFTFVIMTILMEKLKEDFPDENERIKHIIENQIYVCELQSKNMFIYLNLIKIITGNEYKINFHRGSYLEKGFDDKMKTWGVEKFDLGATNPPYTQMIDMDFLSKSYDICDKILFVHPSTWLLDEKNKQKKFLKVKDKIGKDLEKIVLFNGNKVFNIQLFVPCVYTYINKNKKTEGIICDDKILNKTIHYRDIYEINKFSDVDIYPRLKKKILDVMKSEKLSNLDDKKIFNISTKRNSKKWKIDKFKELNTTGDFYINVAQIRGHVNLKSKIMLQDDFYTIVSRDNVVARKIDNHMFFLFKEIDEANNFLKYLKTNFVRFCLSLNKNNSQLECAEMKMIPWLDFSKNWTDEKLYEYFELTEEEIKFIEKVIPKYY
jgi:predicted RNA methylase